MPAHGARYVISSGEGGGGGGGEEGVKKWSVRSKLTKSNIFFDWLLILVKFDQAKPRWRFVFTPSLDLDTFGLKKSVTLLLLILV